jgi:hypothetical protein
MPGVNPPGGPRGDNIYHDLRALEQRVRSLETQQLFIVTDSTGAIRVQLGVQEDGSLGLWVYDTSGNVVAQLGDLGGSFGISTLNSGGSLQQVVAP